MLNEIKYKRKYINDVDLSVLTIFMSTKPYDQQDFNVMFILFSINIKLYISYFLLNELNGNKNNKTIIEYIIKILICLDIYFFILICVIEEVKHIIEEINGTYILI